MTPHPRSDRSVVYGRHGVASALADVSGGAEGARLYLLAGASNPWRREIESLARTAGIAVEFRPRDELDRLAGDRHHQGCVLVGGAVPRGGPARAELSDLLPVEPADAALVLVLDGLEDPRNYGACLRAAAGFGCRAVVTPARRMAPLSAAARKAAAGNERTVPIVETANIASALARLQEGGYWVVGLDPHAPLALGRCDLTGPRVFVVGQEGPGLRRLVRERCDLLAAIPLAPGVESLNVAVAVGVALYEYRRQNDRAVSPRNAPDGAGDSEE
jgi:23S rRNA (guanosine2251-2'-O)-methyltransferase